MTNISYDDLDDKVLDAADAELLDNDEDDTEDEEDDPRDE